MQKTRFMPAAVWPLSGRTIPVGIWRPVAVHPNLGQMPAMAVRDIPRAMSQSDWERQTWTKEGAMAAYAVAALLWAVREKIAFSAVLFQKLVADPRTLGVINRDPKGALFIDATDTLIGLSQQLSLPNLMSSVRNLITAMEVGILPKSFGVEVRALVPLFRGPNQPKPNVLDCTKTGRTGPPGVGMEILDLGDLCGPILSDAKKLESVVRQASNIAGLPAPLTNVLFLPDVVKHRTVSEIADAVGPMVESADLRKAIEGIGTTDPKTRELLENLPIAQKVWAAKRIGTLGWIAIGAGALAAAWLVTSVISAAAAKPAAPKPAVGRRANR